jgi:hypothetical protein
MSEDQNENSKSSLHSLRSLRTGAFVPPQSSVPLRSSPFLHNLNSNPNKPSSLSIISVFLFFRVYSFADAHTGAFVPHPAPLHSAPPSHRNQSKSLESNQSLESTIRFPSSSHVSLRATATTTFPTLKNRVNIHPPTLPYQHLFDGPEASPSSSCHPSNHRKKS